jgi:SAM-dependent methyltransferase
MQAINAMRQDTSFEGIERAARHALMVGQGHLAKIRDWVKRPAHGLDVLELGPGPDFGSTLVMAAHGARIAVADRWPPAWDPAYHRPVYARLAELLEEQAPAADVTPLHQLVTANAHSADVVTIYADAETLAGAAAESFDLVISNAVYEHISDVRQATQRVFDVLRPGGISVQQVDLRDHRDFSRPLEYLLMTATEEAAWLAETAYHSGSPRRQSDYVRAFDAVGFEMLSDWVDAVADPTYLADFVPRLRAYDGARFQNADISAFEQLGTCLVHRKPDRLAAQGARR